MKKLYSLALSLLVGANLMAATQVKVGEDLQAAINAAEAGETVQVQAGTFTGNFQMKDGVNVSGGWNEDFTTQTEYGTVLDAQGDGVVLLQPAAFATLTTWTNFTIQNGCLKAVANGNLGSGVVLNKKGQVTYCLIQNNTYSYTSGNCMGGGLANNEVDSPDDILADHCIIRNNKATHGGGVRVRGTITNCVIEENDATGNNAGGAYLQATGRLYNCIIRKNVAKDTGGVRMYGKNTRMYNCLVYDNLALNKVGGVVNDGELGSIVNCVIANNTQQFAETDKEFCGVRVNTDKDPAGKMFTNNVVWGNKAGDEVQNQQVSYNVCKYETRTHNAFQGIAPADFNAEYISLAADNMAADGPNFVAPGEGDYRLQWTSPLWNAGNTQAVEKIELAEDLGGNVRVQGGIVDLGAYENTTYNLTVGTVENGILVLNGKELTAGVVILPEGYTAALTATPAEGYVLETITLNETALVAEEGVYTLPAMAADATLNAVFATDPSTSIDNIEGGEVIVLGIYDMLGKQVATNTDNLPAGMYIVRTNMGSKKVVIK